ncbi:UNVERIFIED_CONTAM: hypothetical protein FKN15_026462 [Acipenser sinensis]
MLFQYGASDGSSSRDDLSSQLLRRNYQIRKLEAKLSASMRKLQEQNEAYQASRAKMSEGMELALETKDQEKNALTLKLDEMMEQSLNLFQKRDELEGFQQQELAKVKHMLISKEDILMQREKALEKHVLDLKQTREELRQTSEKLASMEENKQCFETQNRELQTEREELLATRVESEKKITELEKRGQELQTVVQQVSEDFQKMANAVEEKDKQIAHLQVKVSSLEKRINSSLSEDEHLQELLKEISELEQRIQECSEKFKKSEEQINDKEAEIKKLSQLEQENKNLKEIRTETENTLKKQEAELERAKTELRSRETVSVEIAKALEETQKQKEELQQQVVKLTITLDDKDQSVTEKTEELTRREEDLKHLKQEFEAAQSHLQQLQTEIESMRRTKAEKEGAAETQLNSQRQEVRTQTEQLETCQTQARADSADWQQEDILSIAASKKVDEQEWAFPLEDVESDSTFPKGKLSLVVHLEAEVQALNERLNPPEDAGKELNGAVTADDVSEIQRLNRELEHQVSEKNKTIKQLQQRLAELKKTLLKELKIKAEVEPPDVKERLGPEPPTIVSAATTVTNNSDLNDSREINFEYLKHVVLKFMSSREAEAYQLIKAVSMLLNFTQEEEDMLKQTLEYKMSWFGSKPSPKGIIRPSVSGAPTHWN